MKEYCIRVVEDNPDNIDELEFQAKKINEELVYGQHVFSNIFCREVKLEFFRSVKEFEDRNKNLKKGEVEPDRAWLIDRNLGNYDNEGDEINELLGDYGVPENLRIYISQTSSYDLKPGIEYRSFVSKGMHKVMMYGDTSGYEERKSLFEDGDATWSELALREAYECMEENEIERQLTNEPVTYELFDKIKERVKKLDLEDEEFVIYRSYQSVSTTLSFKDVLRELKDGSEYPALHKNEIVITVRPLLGALRSREEKQLL